MDVILITIDSLRFDDFMRFARGILNLMKKRSVVFTNATAPGPSTSPSILAMLTSELPLEYGGYYTLSQRRISIAEVMAKHGYTCICLQTNDFLSPRLGWARGFHIYEKLFPEREPAIRKIVKRLTKLSVVGKVLSPFMEALRPDKPVCRADYVLKRALKLFSSIKGPKFLWLHLMDIHAPFIPEKRAMAKLAISTNYERILNSNLKWIYEPEKLKAEDVELLRQLYRAEIVSLDEKLLKWLSHIMKISDLSDLCIVITADHGEEFYDHGGHDHTSKLYDELIHVPLLIMGPGLPEGKVFEGPVSLMDIPPTLVSMALGLRSVNRKWRGIDLTGVVNNDEGSLGRLAVMSEVAHERPWKVDLSCLKVAARSGDWKVIYDAEKKRYEIYDLSSDPSEQHDVSSSAPRNQALKSMKSMVSKRVFGLLIRSRLKRRFKKSKRQGTSQAHKRLADEKP